MLCKSSISFLRRVVSVVYRHSVYANRTIFCYQAGFVKYQIWSMKFFGFGNWQPSKRIYTFYRIFGLVFLIIGLVSLGMMFFQKPTSINPDISECNTFAESHGCQNNSSTECLNSNNQCLVQLGIKNQDVRICDLLNGENKDSCYLGVGANSKNPTICDKITDATYKNQCYQEVAI